MGRQTQLHMLPKDVNELLVAMHVREPLEAALQRGNSETPERIAFIPDKMCGKTLVLWSKRLVPSPAVESVPGKLSDAWVFRGTRVPVSAVFENLEDGLTINEIVQMFDGLSKDPVVTVLEFAAQSLDAPLLAR